MKRMWPLIWFDGILAIKGSITVVRYQKCWNWIEMSLKWDWMKAIGCRYKLKWLKIVLIEEIWTKARATPHNSIFSLFCRYVLCLKKKAPRLTCEQGRCAPWNSGTHLRIKNRRKWQLWRWCKMDVGLFWVGSGGSASKTLWPLISGFPITFYHFNQMLSNDKNTFESTITWNTLSLKLLCKIILVSLSHSR